MRRSFVVVALASFLMLLVPFAHPPAFAADCHYDSWSSGDSATVTRSGKACTYIGVRHKYDPVWSTTNYWTSWVGGAGSKYSTVKTPVLYMVEAKGR